MVNCKIGNVSPGLRQCDCKIANVFKGNAKYRTFDEVDQENKVAAQDMLTWTR